MRGMPASQLTFAPRTKKERREGCVALPNAMLDPGLKPGHLGLTELWAKRYSLWSLRRAPMGSSGARAAEQGPHSSPAKLEPA